MSAIIISRHAGAVAWLAQRGITGTVIAQATPEDVRGRHVVGNLPLHLAALAASVTTLEMPGLTADQRGMDLGPAEMDAAGAVLRRYVVHEAPVPGPAPLRWTWNNGLESRNRRPACLIVNGAGDIREFTGQDIPGWVKVVKTQHEQNGKWSNTTFHCISSPATKIISWRQSWEEGLFWPQASWEEAIAWVQAQAPQAKEGAIRELVQTSFPKTAMRFDENAAAVLALTTGAE